MKLLKYIIIIFFVIITVKIQAQPYVEIATIQYTIYNQAPMKHDLNAQVDHAAWSGSVFLPIKDKKQNYWILGADNVSYVIDYHSSDTSIRSKLASTSVQFGIIKQWKKEKWNTLFLLIPRQAADFTYCNPTDRQLGGLVVNTFAWKKDLKLKFGLYYNREFFGNYFMPLLGLDWKVNERMNIWGLLPGGLNMKYDINKWASCGIKYQSITATFRSEGSDGYHYIMEGHRFWSDQQLSVKGEFTLLKNLVAYAGVGMTGFHYFQEYSKSHDKLKNMVQYQESKDRGFFYGGLSFRVSTE